LTCPCPGVASHAPQREQRLENSFDLAFASGGVGREIDAIRMFAPTSGIALVCRNTYQSVRSIEKGRRRPAKGSEYPEGSMRFLLRFASLVALVVAVIAGTIDSIQSVAASSVVLTPMGDAWKDVSPGSLASLQSLISFYIHPRFYDFAMQWLLLQPAFAIFLVISLLLWMIAYKKPPVAGRFTA
jgi:hypothetical protein